MLAVILLAAGGLALSPLEQTNFNSSNLKALQDQTRDLFFHAWDAYAVNALPFDELRPLTCDGIGPDEDPTHLQRNDVMGNFSITLLDTLDMFAILDRDDLFRKYVDYVEHNVHFDQPHIVQVFETTIRAMGGLLSAHLYASVPELGHVIPGYNGHLLAKAYDLGTRLLPAFNTPTGIPYPRVHLQDGIVPIGQAVISKTCSAGAGSLLLEFGLLSRLTNDVRFDKLAKRACFRIWDKRNNVNLVGMGIDALTGRWLDDYTSIGSSVDSYYECVLKYAILFQDNDMWDIWGAAYKAIQTKLCSGFYYHMTGLYSPNFLGPSIDALSAFWGGVQVLAGHVDDAIQSHLGFLKVWNNWGSIPERWTVEPKVTSQSVILEWYLLRPEFIETTYYLYRATRDPLYLHMGQIVLEDIIKNNKVACGVAATQNVRTGVKSNRMDSFFLSETLKYLYLLFDTQHPLNLDATNTLFTTEAHPFWSNEAIISQAKLSLFPVEQPKVGSQGILAWAYSLVSPYMDFWNTEEQEEPLCEVWPESDYSLVGSWSLYYEVDKDIEFVPPSWLERGDLEYEHEFYRRYIQDDAMCIPFNRSLFRA